jgi:nucleoside 2-deoxyribosyltransferase
MVGYLAGAMSKYYEENRYDEATKWRKYVKDYFNESSITIFDPTDESEKHYKYPPEFYNGVILQNYAYLKLCDFILVNLEYFEDSVGTIWECSIAWAEHKPIIAFGKCNKWKDRPHMRSLITVQLDTVEDASEYILSMYRQKI